MELFACIKPECVLKNTSTRSFSPILPVEHNQALEVPHSHFPLGLLLPFQQGRADDRIVQSAIR